jgi:hypothetical protein
LPWFSKLVSAPYWAATYSVSGSGLHFWLARSGGVCKKRGFLDDLVVVLLLGLAACEVPEPTPPPRDRAYLLQRNAPTFGKDDLLIRSRCSVKGATRH